MIAKLTPCVAEVLRNRAKSQARRGDQVKSYYGVLVAGPQRRESNTAKIETRNLKVSLKFNL